MFCTHDIVWNPELAEAKAAVPEHKLIVPVVSHPVKERCNDPSPHFYRELVVPVLHHEEQRRTENIHTFTMSTQTKYNTGGNETPYAAFSPART